jgi:tripeptidyl-peptidase I
MQGLRGITLFSSSGDIGVGAGCIAPDNKTVEFNPIFPATCPYITSVGGTIGDSPEIAWGGSSGGFSKYFPRPLYQQGAIREYLKQVDGETITYYSNYTNFNGRGFPDVAGHSAKPGYIGIYDGKRDYNGGTSAAAPVWAAVVALLNDARLRAGKSTLGWLNPLLYSGGSKALNDITEGGSMGCNGANSQYHKPEPAGAADVPGALWNATTGWDPATGFGTPDFDKLKTLVLSL